MLCDVPPSHKSSVPRLATSMRPGTPSRINVRPASEADSAAIARVCLLTSYQGKSAESLVRYPELPSQVRALPYLHLPSGFAFVLVETTDQAESEIEPCIGRGILRKEGEGRRTESRRVVGYVVGTSETAQFNREVDSSWWPALRTKYPKDLIGTPLDRYFIEFIHRGQKLTSTGPAYIHVNVINKYKAHGCDRLLFDVAMDHLRTQGRRKRLEKTF